VDRELLTYWVSFAEHHIPDSQFGPLTLAEGTPPAFLDLFAAYNLPPAAQILCWLNPSLQKHKNNEQM
jgi:hypothetical protein